jgi:hypothetical protein
MVKNHTKTDITGIKPIQPPSKIEEKDVINVMEKTNTERSDKNDEANPPQKLQYTTLIVCTIQDRKTLGPPSGTAVPPGLSRDKVFLNQKNLGTGVSSVGLSLSKSTRVFHLILDTLKLATCRTLSHLVVLLRPATLSTLPDASIPFLI